MDTRTRSSGHPDGHPHHHPHEKDDHAHAHGHHHPIPQGDRAIMVAVAVNVGLTAAQVAGGWAADSVALVADGVHNFSDALALILALGARRLARRASSDVMTFGWGRAELVAAFVNQAALIVISIWLAFEAVSRLSDPPPVAGGIVMALAALALSVDLATAALIWRQSRSSLNMRAAFLHNLADAAASVGVLAGGALIVAFGWRIADPLLTLAISAVITAHVVPDLRQVTHILMLGAPRAIARTGVQAALADVPGVIDVHHMHLWQIDEQRTSCEAHVVIRHGIDAALVRRQVKDILRNRFRIAHATIEIERDGEGCA